MNEFVSRDVDGSRDTSGVRNLASFVMKVSEQLPKMMYSNASILLPLLSCGNYVIRNAVVNSLGELCVAFATKATSSGESYNEATRNTFLTLLKERMYDVTAFTRSCCLKMWTRLCEMNAIPISRVLPVTEIAIGRLSDKSAIVRKSAARYLQTVASCGLFGHDLSMFFCVYSPKKRILHTHIFILPNKNVQVLQHVKNDLRMQRRNSHNVKHRNNL
jgi:condensin complex subunit 1